VGIGVQGQADLRVTQRFHDYPRVNALSQ